ncbi:MAG: oligosaccharide flippase family protein [Sphaerochaetaceae bacterium]|nr:oligosaccharide flippase family protein [Sphaerochaetaceae bacterium]MDC7248790.1 oligosaccharide flippase family protein [Sphaerochaetaceae bacterium]
MAKSNKRDLSKKTLIYSFGTVASVLAALFAAPIITNYISPEDFGNYEFTISIMFLVSTFGFLDIPNAMLRFMYGIEKEDSEFQKSTIYSSLLIQFICTLGLFVSVPIINQFMNIPFPKSGLIFGICYSTSLFYLNVARGQDKEINYTVGFSLYHSFYLISIFILVLLLKFPSPAILWSMSIGYSIQIIYLERNTKLLSNFKINYIKINVLKKILRFALPLAIASFGNWILQHYTNIKLLNSMGSYENGIYALALNVSRTIPTLSFGLIMAWQEIAYSNKERDDEKNQYFARVIINIIVILILIYMLFVPTATLVVPYYLGDAYNGLLSILFLTTASLSIDMLSLMLASIIGNSVNSKPIMVSIGIGAIVYLLTIDQLIDYYGLIGAGVANLIGFLTTAIVRLIWIRLAMKIKLPLIRMFLLALVAGIFGYLSYKFEVKGNIILLFVAAIPSIPYFYTFKKKQKQYKQSKDY